jgi:hypothetical protein
MPERSEPCGTDFDSNGLDLIDDVQVTLKVLSDEARVGLAPIVVSEVFDGADLSGEEAVSER